MYMCTANGAYPWRTNNSHYPLPYVAKRRQTMDYFEGVPDFDPDWMAEIEESERRARKAVEQTELMPHPDDFDSPEEWEEAVEQYEFEEGIESLMDKEE